DQRRAPDRDRAVRAAVHAFRILTLVLPERRAGLAVDRLRVVAVVRHVDVSGIGDRRRLLDARAHRLAPDLLQLRDIALVDLLERAVAPAVERPAPHQPVAVARMLEHLIRDGRELLFLGGRGCERAAHREGERQESKSDDRHEFPRRLFLGRPRVYWLALWRTLVISPLDRGVRRAVRRHFYYRGGAPGGGAPGGGPGGGVGVCEWSVSSAHLSGAYGTSATPMVSEPVYSPVKITGSVALSLLLIFLAAASYSKRSITCS